MSSFSCLSKCVVTSFCYAVTSEEVLEFTTIQWRDGGRVVSVLDSGAEGLSSNRTRDAVG